MSTKKKPVSAARTFIGEMFIGHGGKAEHHKFWYNVVNLVVTGVVLTMTYKDVFKIDTNFLLWYVGLVGGYNMVSNPATATNIKTVIGSTPVTPVVPTVDSTPAKVAAVAPKAK